MKTCYQKDDQGPCPFCNTAVRFTTALEKDGLPYQEGGKDYVLMTAKCPACNGVLVTRLQIEHQATKDHIPLRSKISGESLLWPRAGMRPVPQAVPETIAVDYREACVVLGDSPKASAALSRRCLQALLRDKGYEQASLAAQIAEARKEVPSYLGDQLDTIREVGNFAAHPTKDANTGEIVAVEPGEAEWDLDVLGTAFDVFYVQPARADAMKTALNLKLQAAGRKPV